MADNTKLEPRLPPSISQPVITSPVNPLKRKEPPSSSESNQKRFSSAPALPAGVTDIHQGEYEKGRILCDACGTCVGFRDEETGDFTLKHWEFHLLTYSVLGQSSSGPVYTPESTAEALAHLPTKRHHTKCAEEEAQFEVYRVLCAYCDKWIRLRPNSICCSIPWDAHRKSCLAKKVNRKNVDALEERNASFSNDADVREFDAERVPCSICDKWLSINPDDHLQPIQKRLQHRAACQKDSTPILPPNRPTLTEPVSTPSLTEHQMPLAIDPEHGPRSRGVQSPPPHLASISGQPAVGSEQQPPIITLDNHISLANYYLTLAENTIKPTAANVYNEGIAQGMKESGRATTNRHMPLYTIGSSDTLISTYNPELQTFLRHNIQPSYRLDDPAVDTIAQSPTEVVEVSTSTDYVTRGENINNSAFTNAYTAQGISESLAVANHLMPVYSVRNSHTFTSTHNSELQTLASSGNNVQQFHYPVIPTVGSILQSPTMAVEVPTSANYSLSLDKNTNMYSPVPDGKTVNWRCNFSGCRYVSRWKREMERHCSNLRHGGCREHKCKYCGKAFMRNDTLSRHVKSTRCWLRQA